MELEENKWSGIELMFAARGREQLSAESLSQDQCQGIGDQQERHHFLHESAVFVHQFLEVEQVLQIPEGFFDLHPLEIIGQSKHGFHVGHDPHGVGKAFLPNADYVHLYLTFVEDLFDDAGLANRDT
jgi:hypothetical protein